MEHHDLKIQVGEAVQLQPHDGEAGRRMNVRIIGYMAGVSLLVTTPRTGDKVMIIREGQPFVARMMAGNQIVGFTTTVLRTCTRPFPYLHLSYPQEMEQITVRKAQRVRVRLFASVKNSGPDFQPGKPHTATIVDISISGALLIADVMLGEVGDKVSLSCAVRVGDVEKLLNIPAIIRSLQVEHSAELGRESHFHGLEFDVQDKQDLFALHGYVYEQIVRSLSE
ncbi:MAG TPA: flagellar brake protein [Gammaproteobacteria bacterium]|nr:flagellar brake protein [Gammaproteobacteria bacterium]